MKRSFVCSLVALVLLAFVTSGCVHRTHSANFNPAPRGKSVALAITVTGGTEPTPAQWSAILQVVEPQLVAQGWVLVTDFASAENILRINFSPNPNDPDHSGHASILSFRANPLRALAVLSPRRYPGSSGSFSHASYPGGYHNFLGYDRYDRFYDDYYTYFPPTRTVPPPTTPPTTKPTRPGHRGDDDCPPGERRPVPPWVAQVEAARLAAPPAEYGRSRSEGSYSSSGSSHRGSDSSSSYSNSAPSSRADTTYSRAEPSYTSYSSSSSGSSSSYSAPSSSSSSSSGSSSGSSGTHQSTQAHQN